MRKKIQYPLGLRYPIALGEGPDPLPPLDPCMLRHVYKAECVMMLLTYPLFYTRYR